MAFDGADRSFSTRSRNDMIKSLRIRGELQLLLKLLRTREQLLLRIRSDQLIDGFKISLRLKQERLDELQIEVNQFPSHSLISEYMIQ